MLKYYLVVAARNIGKHRLVSAINIGGLAIGFAAAILIALYVQFELSFDSFWTKAERIYRVEVVYHNPGGDTPSLSSAPGPFRNAAVEAFPVEIEQATRIVRNTTRSIRRGDSLFSENIRFVDSNFFSIFDIPVISGDRELALTDNQSLMISARMATKYFGDQSPLGETILVEDIDYTIVAVSEDMPQNTHLDTDFIALFDEPSWGPGQFSDWGNPTMFTYLLLNEGVDPRMLESQLPGFLDRVASNTSTTPSEFINLSLIPVLDSHMVSVEESGDYETVYTFSLIAVLILFVAGINFVNLATARSVNRAREVSIRKVMGARRAQLITQFLSESILVALASLAAAIGIVVLALPMFNAFLNTTLELDLFGNPEFAIGLVATALFVGGAAGLYPAFILSMFRPATNLRSSQSTSNGTSLFRNTLVVIQFAISIALIISTLVIYGQTDFARNIDTGFQKEMRVVLRGVNPNTDGQVSTLRSEMMRLPEVRNVTFSLFSMPFTGGQNEALIPPNSAFNDRVMVEMASVDFNFFDVFEIEPVAGRVFSEDRTADELVFPPGDFDPTAELTFSVVLNESALSKFGFATADAALGQLIGLPTSPTSSADGQIVGVVPDFLSRSLKVEKRATVFWVFEPFFVYMMLQVQTNDLPATLAAIDDAWVRAAPNTPVNRVMVEEIIDTMYLSEDKQGQMFMYFAALAVVVAGLGLLGLASFASERRTKEIGLRKVMGASVADIIKLLVWEFSKPVILANLLAWPVVWYFMDGWLQDFESRISLSPILFVGAGAAALLAAWLTVAGHALKVARTHPSEALRHE